MLLESVFMMPWSLTGTSSSYCDYSITSVILTKHSNKEKHWENCLLHVTYNIYQVTSFHIFKHPFNGWENYFLHVTCYLYRAYQKTMVIQSRGESREIVRNHGKSQEIPF